MNLINPQRLEDYIVKLLMEGEQSTTSLLSRVRVIRKNTTKQGFYAALRKLKAEEVALTYKGKVSLSTVWINKMKSSFEEIGRKYAAGQASFSVLDLDDRESMSYSFSTIKNLDIFWGYSQSILMHNTPDNNPIYAYDPHYWFYFAHKETETELLKEIVQHKRQFLMTVGGATKLDKAVKPHFNNKYLQYNHKKLFRKDNYYITVIGDYISEVMLDEGTGKKIDNVYGSTNELNDAIVEKLKQILEAKVRCKIKISKNKSKADKLKKMMGRDFYILKK